MSAPAGFGKTTLIASYLDSRKLPCLWYQADAGDGDIASFFYYMGQARREGRAAIQEAASAPDAVISSERVRLYPALFRRITPPAAVVFDNYQDTAQGSGFHEMIAPRSKQCPKASGSSS